MQLHPPDVTIADGIAVKRPGELTLSLMREVLDGIELVDEDDVAEAMVLLMERAKLVVEGAGAVGVGGAAERAVAPAPEGATVIVLSGGNVDAGLLASVARRHETEAGRRVALLTKVPDRRGRWPRCWRGSRRRAPTSWRSSTCARASTCTCARPPSSSCSRRAVRSTPIAC